MRRIIGGVEGASTPSSSRGGGGGVWQSLQTPPIFGGHVGDREWNILALVYFGLALVMTSLSVLFAMQPGDLVHYPGFLGAALIWCACLNALTGFPFRGWTKRFIRRDV